MTGFRPLPFPCERCRTFAAEEGRILPDGRGGWQHVCLMCQQADDRQRNRDR